LTVGVDIVPIDLKLANCGTSFAIGALIESLCLNGKVADELAMNIDYCSPTQSAQHPHTSIPLDTIITDACSVENSLVIPFLQRRCERIIAFINCVNRLHSRKEYNRATDIYTGDQVSTDLAALFGILDTTQSFNDKRSYYYQYLQEVFTKEDYIRVIHGLQDALESGHGVFTTQLLTTKINDVVLLLLLELLLKLFTKVS
jgi:hypothetical protein